MRYAASFALAFTVTLATGALFLACGAGEKEDPPGTRGTGGAGGYDLDQIFGNRDAGSDGSTVVPNDDAGPKDAGSDANDIPDAAKPVTCESCGSAQSATECGAALAACRANLGCKRIYDCIYTFRGCGLTSSDIPCIQGCIDDYCDDARSVELYLAYDQCAYCRDACRETCSSYCSGFPNDGMIPNRCTDGVSDAGTDAEPIADAGAPDAADASEDAGDEPDAEPEPEDAGPQRVCIPGQQIACACIGGGQGAQVCNAEGTGYGPCVCPRPDAGSETGGGQGGAGGSGGAGGAGGSGGGDDDEEDDDDEDDEEDDEEDDDD